MRGMFVSAHRFNQPLAAWNTSRVTDMFCFFLEATSFNQRLARWDVSSEVNMEGMFLRVRKTSISRWATGASRGQTTALQPCSTESGRLQPAPGVV